MICLLFLAFATCGYFARPWIEPLISEEDLEKSIPELRSIYEPSAQLNNSIRNPVIVIPGMMGSTLEQTSKDRMVWGVFDNQSIDINNAEDVRLLACPIDGANLDDFDDGVYATGVLDSLEIDVAGLSIHLKSIQEHSSHAWRRRFPGRRDRAKRCDGLWRSTLHLFSVSV